MLKFISKHREIIYLLALIIAIAPYIYISIYANPIADDFNNAAKGKANNLWIASTELYFNWGGRYASNIFVLLNPLVFDSFVGYKIVPPILITLTICAYFIFIQVIIGDIINKVKSLQIAFLLTLLFIYQMPIISEGIYWYTGAVTYHLANIIALIYIALLYLFFQQKYLFQNKNIHVIIVSLFLFILIGFNEIHMISSLILSFVIFLIDKRQQFNNKNFVIYLLIITVLFCVLEVFAPGNSKRGSHAVAQNHRFFHSLFSSILQTSRFFLEWLSSTPLLLLSVLYYYLNEKLSKTHKLFSNSFYLSPLVSSFLLLFIIFFCSFLPYWATGILGQHRTLNIAYFMFIILWFINLTVCYNYFRNKIGLIKELSFSANLTILFLVWSSLVFTKNGFDIMIDITSGKAIQYNNDMIKRYSLLDSPRDTIYFKPITNPPKTLFVLDITHDPNYWLNTGYNKYFKTDKKIMIEK